MAGDIVKSVGRVFEVLEVFKNSQRPMTATEVGNQLGYPNSSTIALLKSMSTLGYLSFDRNQHCYFPTMRLPLLTGWIEQAIYADNEIHSLIEQLHESTGETVALSVQNDLQMQFMHILIGNHPVSLNLKEGQLVPLFHTAIGHAALTFKSDKEICRLTERYRRRQRQALDDESLLESIASDKKRGYSIAYDQLVEGLAAVAAPVPKGDKPFEMVISIGGPVDRFKRNEAQLIDALCSVLS